jgi:hypothetical protein
MKRLIAVVVTVLVVFLAPVIAQAITTAQRNQQFTEYPLCFEIWERTEEVALSVEKGMTMCVDSKPCRASSKNIANAAFDQCVADTRNGMRPKSVSFQ